ncbi:hypothetical protein A3B51_00765 [Candidatus Curtissbacteria bacterium RIFCSPLOWO2_01_FULL_41_18]|uniref:Methyltransferase type 11 domain-containing protein n=1 Tax=Candidatus Curtissbacteria bacterium RIFCSPLOWO2_01_FULL_41_18 TaxID=1797727 RepID=A0A1F5HHZ4_9BACT|nr:MAG: hypothetical protein A3B51_00765 [Candidatus Curtissbacteria bacterium RIFCSPLOWO2_01_FULL_41_18]
MYKLLLPYDVYERHRKVASFIKENETVVDIGGELDHLSQFINPKKLIVANLRNGDVIILKDKLPFEESSFDIVCAIDVLEHIPKAKRGQFINSLLVTASKKVIMSFPIATASHTQYEKETLKWLQANGKNVEYLKEHIRFSLPTKEEVKQITAGEKVDIFYSGNLALNRILFRIFMIDPKIKFARRLIYVTKLIFNLITNQFFYLILSDKPYSDSVNRAYLIINKHT